MRTVVATRAGGPEVLEVRPAADPSPGPGQVVIAAEAAAVAFADTLVRRGVYPGAHRPPIVPGYGCVGTVRALGAGVTGLTIGTRVAALTVTGGYAEQVLAPAAQTVAMPAGPPAAALAPLVLNDVTAWQLLHRVAQVQPGQTVLVLGGAGGVGTALLELCALAGVRAIATASGGRTAQITERGGLAIDRQTQDVAAEVRRLAPGGVDATFDPVGGPSLAVSRSLTARGGVVVSYGAAFAAGTSRARLLAGAGLALARARLTPGPRTVLYTIAGHGSWLARNPHDFAADLAHLAGLVAGGTLAPRYERLPLAQAAEAHRRLEAGEVLGTLVLVP